MDEIYEQLEKIMEETFATEDIKLTAESTAKDVDEWDSLNHIRFMLAVQNHYEFEFSTAEIGNLENVGELVQLIRSKL